MTLHAVGSRTFQLVRSIVVLGAAAVAAPMALMWAATERFGGGSPFAAVPAPADWEWARIRAALTDRLSEDTVADIVIRLALVVAWVALVVFVVTVVAEAVHMARHAGLHLPDVRGLGFTQHAARIVAAGLLVVVPMLSTPNRAIARGDTTLTPLPRAATAAVVVDQVAPALPSAPTSTATVAPTASPAATPEVQLAPAVEVPPAATTAAPGGRYVVRSGDSIYAIAQQLVGPHAGAVADYAEQLIDLNFGRDMGDGRRFTNAAFIDAGWVLQLPGGSPAAVASSVDAAHVVERGESLWSIADDELGDPLRWPEVFDANAGRAFEDGRTLDDPSLIQPGWDLRLPGGAPAEQLPPPVVAPPLADPAVTAVEPSPPPAAAPTVGVDLDAHHRADHRADRYVALPPPAAPAAEAARPDNVWVATPGPDVAEQPAVERQPTDERQQGVAGLVSMRGAAMVSAGVLTLLASRRRQQLRSALPRARLPVPTSEASATERTLRAIDAAERLARVDIAVRSAALPLIHRGGRVLAVTCAPDGELELIADAPAVLPAPWVGADDRWRVPATTPIELLGPTARQVGAPCPTLVQLGVDLAGRDVFVDLEALEAIEIGGPDGDADAIVTAIAVSLAGSTLAEVTTLVSAGVDAHAFLGHRLHRTAADPVSAFEIAAKAIGATASMTASTFELRARVTSGETWEPSVVLLASSSAEAVRPPRNRTGLTVVSAAPIEGPSSRLAPEDDAWVLMPLGLRFLPIGLRPAEVDAIADLVEGAATVPAIPASDDPAPDGIADDAVHEPDGEPVPGVEVVAPDGDDTIHPAADQENDVPEHTITAERRRPSIRRIDEPVPAPSWHLLVRLLGPVDVVDAGGTLVEFERSKTRELVAWLATHRDRATRANARTALWEQDVRDATFANVVSEARRSLARLVDPPDGDEWVGRTLTDALPLHAGVLSDADLVERALAAARVQPPDQAIVTLTPAVEWIAGMPFDGTSYLWPDAEGITSSLILLATSAAAELAAHCLSVGDVEGVFRATGRGLRVLPGHEELIGLRMRAHARVGDLAGVRSEWETYERMINADPWSDGEPSPKLVDLRRQLLNPSR